MEKVRIGFIGCGGVSNGHAKRIIAMPDAEIVAICDNNSDQIKAYKERYPELANVESYTDWEEMLDKAELDAIEIHTPHTLHFEQIMAGLDRGLHVLTEKPMVCRTDHAVEIAKKVQSTGLKLQVSYQRHFGPEYRWARELIASGKLGDVHFVTAWQCQNWKESQTGTWRQKPELSGGGQLNDSGSHLVDIVLWVTGLQADEVSAYVDFRGRDVDINSAVAVSFTNGAKGTINIIGDAWRWEEEITIMGDKGMIMFRRDGSLLFADETGEIKTPEKMPQSTDPDRNFVDAILGKDELQVPFECGLRVIELTEAAWQSGKGGKPVKVDHSLL